MGYPQQDKLPHRCGTRHYTAALYFRIRNTRTSSSCQQRAIRSFPAGHRLGPRTFAAPAAELFCAHPIRTKSQQLRRSLSFPFATSGMRRRPREGSTARYSSYSNEIFDTGPVGIQSYESSANSSMSPSSVQGIATHRTQEKRPNSLFMTQFASQKKYRLVTALSFSTSLRVRTPT